MLTFAIRQLPAGTYAAIVYQGGSRAIAATLPTSDRNVAARAAALLIAQVRS